MSHPIPTHDRENELPEDDYSPADHWSKIMEITETLKVQVADLEEQLKDFNKSAL